MTEAERVALAAALSRRQQDNKEATAKDSTRLEPASSESAGPKQADLKHEQSGERLDKRHSQNAAASRAARKSGWIEAL